MKLNLGLNLGLLRTKIKSMENGRSVVLLIPWVSAQASAITWTGNAGNNCWSSPENWSTDKVPTTYQGVVVIPEGVTVDVDIKNTPVNLQCEGNITVNNDVIFSLIDGSFIKGQLTNNGSISFNKGIYTFSGCRGFRIL